MPRTTHDLVRANKRNEVLLSWIQRQKPLKPQIVLLEIAAGQQADEVENCWIATFRGLGDRLLNRCSSN